MNPSISIDENCFIIPPLPAPRLGGAADAVALRREILARVAPYIDVAFTPQPFVPGVTTVPVLGKIFDADDVQHGVEASLDFWLTPGRHAAQFETELAAYMGCRSASLVNSGLRANVLALLALTSPKLGERRLGKGDEVITVAIGSPAALNAIIQNRLVPVFVDVNPRTYNIDASQLEAARSPRTRAVMLAHALGNPFDVAAVADFCKQHDLFLIEDCCEAIGSTFNGQKCGTFGDLATASFNPITTAECGAVLSNQPGLERIIESFRDCGCDELPSWFDREHYPHIRYSPKTADLPAAVGVSQLAKLPGFIEARKRNFCRLYEGLAGLADFLVLPEATPGSDPGWFGFPLAVRTSAPFTREQIVGHLQLRKIATQPLFADNLLRQPACHDAAHRKVGDLPNTDLTMRQAFWLGIYPGLTPPMLDHVVESIHTFCARASRDSALAA